MHPPTIPPEILAGGAVPSGLRVARPADRAAGRGASPADARAIGAAWRAAA